MWPMKPTLYLIRVRAMPLQPVTSDLKAFKKFCKKYFGGCGNFDQVYAIVESKKPETGFIKIHAEIPKGVYKSLLKKSEALGIIIEISPDLYLSRHQESIRSHYANKRKPWVLLEFY